MYMVCLPAAGTTRTSLLCSYALVACVHAHAHAHAQEPCEREHWLAHEDKNEPDMALKRRRIMGLDEE